MIKWEYVSTRLSIVTIADCRAYFKRPIVEGD